MLAPLVLSRHFRTGSNRRRGFAYGFIAGLAGSAGNVACYQAMAAGGKAAAVIPLTSLYPLVTIVLARVVLRERLNPIQFCGIGVSLLALFVLNVGGNSAWLTPWLVVALIPVALWGVAALLQKLATFHATTELSTFAFLLGFAPLAVLTPLLINNAPSLHQRLQKRILRVRVELDADFRRQVVRQVKQLPPG